MDCMTAPHSQAGEGYCSGNILDLCILSRVWFSISLLYLLSDVLDMQLLYDLVEGLGRCWWPFRVLSILLFHLSTALALMKFFASDKLRGDLVAWSEAIFAALFASESASSLPGRSACPATHLSRTLCPRFCSTSTSLCILTWSWVNSLLSLGDEAVVRADWQSDRIVKGNKTY